MLGQQIDRPLRQRITLLAPEVPSDVGVDVVGFEANRLQDA